VTLGLEMLRIRHLIEEEDGFLRIAEANRHVLDYYANSIEHLLPKMEAAEVSAPVGAPSVSPTLPAVAGMRTVA
jgi:hypothetical protein